jgi:choline dehydrogenase-like flavoprotein
MFIDARSLPNHAVLQADVCIAGAGAAGIALAREFLGTDVKVLLLEGGALKFNHRSQFMYRGTSSGRPYLPLEFTRRRQYGGTTVTWSGRCRPLDAIDFEARPWVPHSGWPFGKQDLDPYYARAHPVCGLGPYDYSPAAWGAEPVPASSAGLQAVMFQFSPPFDFGARYRDELEGASNLQVYLHAGVTGIRLGRESETVSHLEVRSARSHGFRVQAKIFVLAVGGLENARLLLASQADRPAGLGNENDLVGRFFMDHPYLTAGFALELPASLPPVFTKLDFEAEQKDLGPVAGFGFGEATMRSHGLLNASATLVRRPAYKLADAYFSTAMADLMQVNDILRHATAPSLRIIPATLRTALQAGRIGPVAAKGLRHRLSPTHGWGIRFQLETAPNPESRVRLTDRRDALGLPRLDLRWAPTAQDLDHFHRFSKMLFAALPEWNIRARAVRHDRDPDGWPVTLQIGKHHMGTTRMDSDSRHGVVDAHCRLHSTSNLYVAGSSVFPTSGMANPTLTIVALALRLADQIKTVLAK